MVDFIVGGMPVLEGKAREFLKRTIRGHRLFERVARNRAAVARLQAQKRVLARALLGLLRREGVAR